MTATAPEPKQESAQNPPPQQQHPCQKKLAIIQVPEDIAPEALDLIKSNLDKMVATLSLDGSEIRMLRPDKGGRPKKWATKEEEQEHWKHYFRNYYQEKLNKEASCPHCNKHFKTYTSVNRHLKQNKSCQLVRLQKEVNALQQQQPPQEEPEPH